LRKNVVVFLINRNRFLFSAYVSLSKDRQTIFSIFISIFLRGSYRRGKTQSAYVNVRIKIHLPSIVPRPVRSSLVGERNTNGNTRKKKNDAERERWCRIVVFLVRKMRSYEKKIYTRVRWNLQLTILFFHSQKILCFTHTHLSVFILFV